MDRHEEIELEKEFIEQAKAELLANPRLQLCQLCLHFDPKDDDSKEGRCVLYNLEKKAYNYGAHCFLTNEIALRALLLQERKRGAERKAKLLRKMDIMEALINGADMVRDDIQEMLETDYRRLDIKAKNDDQIYQRSMKNLKRLEKAYAEMKASFHKIELAYRNYCEYWHQFMFADENGKFDIQYDKYKSNHGFLTYCTFILDDAMYESEENVEKFTTFLNNLPRKRESPLKQEDLKRYLIKV